MNSPQHSPLFSTCPKCGHQRQAAEAALSPDMCPACGLIFTKWIRRGSFIPSVRSEQEGEGHESAPPWFYRLIEVSNPVSPLAWWNHLILWCFLVIWSWRLAGMDYRTGEMGGSFMHAILLPIHEAGHVLFMPFGEFLTIAGGSLFQYLLPLFCAAAFLVKNRDPFGAAIGLWWSGTSLLDLAPYIYDAKAPQLILLGGHTGEDGPHDWIYLLDQFGKVSQSPAYGTTAHTLGILVMVLGLAWSAAMILRQRNQSSAKTTIK